jgi:hypothetical protein
MASEIKAKFGTETALTITLTSLASSTAGVGRQSTMVDNTTTRYQKVHVYVKVKTGTSPTASKGIYAYLIRADKASSPDVITDNAGASDAALTVVSAQQVGGAATTNVTGVTYSFDFTIHNPGPSWGIAIVHDTGVNTDASVGSIYWVGENPEAA